VLDVEHAYVIVLTRKLTSRAGHGPNVLSATDAVQIVRERNDLILIADQHRDGRQHF
jgi:hypothetical protein